MFRESVIALSLFLSSAIGVAPPVSAQASDAGDHDGQDSHEMTTFELVFFLEGDPEEPIPEYRAPRIANAHIHWVRNLINDDVALISGPVEGAGRLQQVAVLKTGSVEDARQMFHGSPAVRFGQLEMDVYRLWAADGILRKPTKSTEREMTVYLGLLKRPEDAPEFSEEQLRRLQAGHLANIQAMADSGDLALAGPIEGSEELRGILIFRSTDDPDHLRELVDRDPSVQAGRLELELYPWTVARGSFATGRGKRAAKVANP